MKPYSIFPLITLGKEVRAWALDLLEGEVATHLEPHFLTRFEAQDYIQHHQIHEPVVSQNDFRYGEEASGNMIPPPQDGDDELEVGLEKTSQQAMKSKQEDNRSKYGFRSSRCIRRAPRFFTPFDTAPLHLKSMRNLRRVVIMEDVEEEEREEREQEERLKAEKDGIKVSSTGDDFGASKQNQNAVPAAKEEMYPRFLSELRVSKIWQLIFEIYAMIWMILDFIWKSNLTVVSQDLYPAGVVPIVRRNCIVVYNLPSDCSYAYAFSALGDLIGIDCVNAIVWIHQIILMVTRFESYVFCFCFA